MTPALTNQCKRCNNPVSHADMRMDNDGSTIICADCYDIKSGKKPIVKPFSATDELNIQLVNETPEQSMAAEDDNEYIVYHCVSCNFKFSRKRNFKFNNCPYCGKQTVVKYENNLTASNLLKDSE